ncbi:Uncharacterized protein PBTT_05062 [Plasmodiophora brassicae]|uniref:Uncharacterized protein n=1 Tax=Plasmodiophora brassicae TaxID=37360 RepID=A0A0G4J0J5_PLABS|nr:hypothetical protein PBRA_008364 [Plasmodiophora brassicae]SPQ98486.1 unnamed protein product [Plasmodiophora brassicae]
MQRRTVGGAAAGAWRYARRPMGQYSHVCDNDPEVIGQHVKRDTIKRAQGDADWDEYLASDSEAIVKAERSPEMPVQKLQEVTVRHLHDADADPSSAGDNDAST